MEPLDIPALEHYVNNEIVHFHRARLGALEELKLLQLLKKNPYLFRAKNLTTAGELVSGLLDAHLSSSEERRFGAFLEDLALFVAQQTSEGHKSAARGVDLEFLNKGIHYVVSIKSGPNWGNSSQQNTLEQDLRDAVRRIRQSQQAANVQPVLGICYGKTRTSHMRRGYMKVVGQNFWYLISESKDLYTDIIEPIGYRAKEHNEAFTQERGKLTNRLTKEFIDDYCDPSGEIDWLRLVESACKNYDLGNFLPA